jgi:hypothetical protein
MSLQLEDTQMKQTDTEKAVAIADKILASNDRLIAILDKTIARNEHLCKVSVDLETMLKEAQALLDDALATIARKDVRLADREEFMTIMSKAKCTYGKSFTGEVSSCRFDLMDESLALFQKRLKRLNLSVD